MTLTKMIFSRSGFRCALKHVLFLAAAWIIGCMHEEAAAQKSAAYVMTPLQFKERLKGPILSAPTAFTEDGNIDYAGMEKVIERALDHGCKVITLTSGNSRYDRISYQEIKNLTRLIVNTVGDRGITIAATYSKWSMDTIIAYVRYAESIGASAVQVDCPSGFQEDSSIEAIKKFYATVAAQTHLGIVLHGYYSAQLLKQLVTVPSVVALKEDVADLNYYVQRQIVFGDRLAVFAGGSDSRYLFGYAYGSPAYFSTLYSYAPGIGQQYWKAIQAKDLKKAVAIANRYDIPFMKHWSFPFWTAAIEYLGGSQRFIRYKTGDKPDQQTLTNENLIKMQEFLCSIGLKPDSQYCCADVTEGISLPDGWERGGQAGGRVEDMIMVTGGTQWNHEKTMKKYLSHTAVFRSGYWEQGPSLPVALAYPMYGSDSSGLYIAGGVDSGLSVLNKAYCLHALSQGWQPLPSLPAGMGYGAGAVLNGKFYVACGADAKGNSNRMWVLDTKNIKTGWKTCAPLPGTGRMFPALVACGKYLYLLGGLSQTTPLTPLKDAYRYDTSRNQWLRLADLPIEGYAWVGKAIDNDHLIITGRAFGQIDKGIWILNLEDMSMNKIGENNDPATTAPLVQAGPEQWWLIGGEPDANKNRSRKVSIITLK